MNILNNYMLVCKVSFLAPPCLCAFGINFGFTEPTYTHNIFAPFLMCEKRQI